MGGQSLDATTVKVQRNTEVANPGRKQVEEREDDPVATNFAKYMARSEGRFGATQKVALTPAERNGWMDPPGVINTVEIGL